MNAAHTDNADNIKLSTRSTNDLTLDYFDVEQTAHSSRRAI